MQENVHQKEKAKLNLKAKETFINGKGWIKGKGKGEEKGGKGKAKGRGFQDKGASKGKGPQYGGCYTCGGAHFGRDCPKGAAVNGAVKSLSSIRETIV